MGLTEEHGVLAMMKVPYLLSYPVLRSIFLFLLFLSAYLRRRRIAGENCHTSTAPSSGPVARALGGPIARAAIDVGQPHEPEGAQSPREGTTQLLPEQRGGRAFVADHPRRTHQRALRRRAAVPGADARAQSVEQPCLDDELLREVRHEVRRKPLQRRGGTSWKARVPADGTLAQLAILLLTYLLTSTYFASQAGSLLRLLPLSIEQQPAARDARCWWGTQRTAALMGAA